VGIETEFLYIMRRTAHHGTGTNDGSEEGKCIFIQYYRTGVNTSWFSGLFNCR
jgi:hypothetical protein